MATAAAMASTTNAGMLTEFSSTSGAVELAGFVFEVAEAGDFVFDASVLVGDFAFDAGVLGDFAFEAGVLGDCALEAGVLGDCTLGAGVLGD